MYALLQFNLSLCTEYTTGICIGLFSMIQYTCTESISRILIFNANSAVFFKAFYSRNRFISTYANIVGPAKRAPVGALLAGSALFVKNTYLWTCRV